MNKNYFITNNLYKLLLAFIVALLFFNPTIKSWGQTTSYTENFTVSTLGAAGTSYYSTSFTTNAGTWQRVNVGYSSSGGVANSAVAKFKAATASTSYPVSITSPALKGVFSVSYSALENAAVSNTLTLTDGGSLSNVFSYTSASPFTTVYSPSAPITPSATSNGIFTFAFASNVIATHYLDDIVFTFKVPTTQASAVTASTVTQNSMNLAWTRPNSGNDNQGCIVFVGPSATTFVAPTNSISYTANATYGLGNQIGSTGYFCVYNGTGTSASVAGLAPGNNYSVYVLEYNGITGQSDENYNGNNPATVTQTMVASPTPIISLTPAALAFGYIKNNLTSTQFFNMTAGTLSPATGNITITAPAGFQVSTSSTTGFASSINLPYINSALGLTTVYVKFMPTVSQSYNGSISLSGGGATASETLTGSGTAYNVGSYKSVATGNWGLAATWNKWDGAAWSAATDFPNSATADVYVLGGFNVNVDASARSCANLYIDENSQLVSANLVNTISYLKPYGSIVNVTPGSRLGNALTGNSADGLSLDVFSNNLTITGGGAISLSRIRTNTANTLVTIDTDITLNYHGQSNTGNAFSYYTVAGDNNILTVNAGKTVTFAPWSCFAYNSSSHSIASNLSQTINLYGTMTFVDGDLGGTLTTNGWTGHTNNYFSMNVNNAATSTLNVYNGGILNVSEFYPNGTNAANTPGVGNVVTINVATGGKINVSKIADFRNVNQTVTGGGEFNLLAGATLKIGATTGITSSGATGPIQTTTRGFNAGSTYSYEGIAPQVTGNGMPSNVSGLAVNNTTGVTLTSATTVNGILTLTSGNLITGSNSLTLGTASSLGTPATGWVVGPLSKQTATTASPTFTFPIGDATNYTPIALAFNGSNTAATTGTITASTTVGEHPQVATSGIDNANSVNRTWTLTNNGVTGFTDYSATLNYAAADNDVTSVPANYVVRKYNASTWTAPTTTATPSATTAVATGLVDFGDFAVGTSTGAPTVSLQPLASSICDGNNTSFTATATTSTLPTTIKWQRSTDGTSWTDVTANLDAGTTYSNFTTGTLTLTGSAAGLNNYQYRAVFTSINGITNSNAVTLTVNTAAAPTASAQSFCNSGTVAGLTATGTGLQWYSVATNGTALISTDALTTGTYYVSQTISSCEGPRTSVAVTVNTTAAPTGAATQSLSSLLTISSIVVTGTNVVWYASSANAAAGTNALPSTTPLTNTTYYATQTIGGCTSATSLAVTITTLANQEFELDSIKIFPNPSKTNFVTITSSINEDIDVEVFDLFGKHILTQKVNYNILDISDLNSGIYLLKISQKEKTTIKKLMVK